MSASYLPILFTPPHLNRYLIRSSSSNSKFQFCPHANDMSSVSDGEDGMILYQMWGIICLKQWWNKDSGSSSFCIEIPGKLDALLLLLSQIGLLVCLVFRSFRISLFRLDRLMVRGRLTRMDRDVRNPYKSTWIDCQRATQNKRWWWHIYYVSS